MHSTASLNSVLFHTSKCEALCHGLAPFSLFPLDDLTSWKCSWKLMLPVFLNNVTLKSWYLMRWHLTCHNISVTLHWLGCRSVITAVLKFWQRGAFLSFYFFPSTMSHHNCFLPHLWTVTMAIRHIHQRTLLLFCLCECKKGEKIKKKKEKRKRGHKIFAELSKKSNFFFFLSFFFFYFFLFS